MRYLCIQLVASRVFLLRSYTTWRASNFRHQPHVFMIFYGAQRSQSYSHRSWFLQGSRRVYPSNSRCLQPDSSLAGGGHGRPSGRIIGPQKDNSLRHVQSVGTRRSVFCRDSNTVSALISVGFGLRFLLRTLLVSMFAQTRRRQFHLKIMRRQIH